MVDRTGIKESQRKTFSTSSSNYSYDGAVIQSITDSARHMVICDLLRNEEALATSTPLNSPLHNHLGPQDSGNISDLIYEGGESTRFLTATDWTDQTESKPTDENLNNEVFHNERSSPEGHENPPPFVDQNQVRKICLKSLQHDSNY